MSGVRGVCCPGPAHQRMSLRRQPVNELCGSGPLTKKSHAIPPGLVCYGARKRWNCNDAISMCERLTGELHATLLRLVTVVVRVALSSAR